VAWKEKVQLPARPAGGLLNVLHRVAICYVIFVLRLRQKLWSI